MNTFIHMLMGAGITLAIIGGFVGAFMFGLGGKGIPWIFRPFTFIMMPRLYFRSWGWRKRRR